MTFSRPIRNLFRNVRDVYRFATASVVSVFASVVWLRHPSASDVVSTASVVSVFASVVSVFASVVWLRHPSASDVVLNASVVSVFASVVVSTASVVVSDASASDVHKIVVISKCHRLRRSRELH